MNENAYMAEFAENLWNNYIRLKIKDELQQNVSYYKATVTSNPGDGTLNVQRPFDNVVKIRCTDDLKTVAEGTLVTVLVFGRGNATNHIAVSADGMKDLRTASASLGDQTPIMDGTATAGTSTAASREDHVHPTDTSRQAVINANNKLSASYIDGLYAAVTSAQSSHQFYHTFGVSSGQIGAGSWQNFTSTNINVPAASLGGGFYVVNYVVSIRGTATGMATVRFTLGGTEINATTERTRQSVPTSASLVSTFNVTFIWNANNGGNFGGWPQIYSDNAFTVVCAFVGMFRIGDTWTSS